MLTATAATLAATTAPALGASRLRRVFIASSTPNGILAYDWNPATAELTPAGVAAQLAKVAWIAFSPGHEFLFAASEVDSFDGKPTGEVASFRVVRGELHPLSARNSAGIGTCHLSLDRSGHVLVSADYMGGSAASFRVTEGKLSPAVWTDFYTVHGPNKERQESAHAHFASFSPDNRFAYINDLGGDCIHIYSLNAAASAALIPAGFYRRGQARGRERCTFTPTATLPTASTNSIPPWTCWSGTNPTAALLWSPGSRCSPRATTARPAPATR